MEQVFLQVCRQFSSFCPGLCGNPSRLHTSANLQESCTVRIGASHPQQLLTLPGCIYTQHKRQISAGFMVLSWASLNSAHEWVHGHDRQALCEASSALYPLACTHHSLHLCYYIAIQKLNAQTPPLDDPSPSPLRSIQFPKGQNDHNDIQSQLTWAKFKTEISLLAAYTSNKF